MASTDVHAPITMRLPFSAVSVAEARHRLKTWMGEMGGSEEAVEDARVVVSELVANSVRHARPLPDGKIVVSWRHGDEGVELCVTDGGSQTQPRNVHAPSSALAGRGMGIVETLALRWWAERSSCRSTVHVLIPS